VRLPHIDRAREIDWGKTSRDYAEHRPGYPEPFYELLAALGIGRPGQRILDLGTGTGVLARAFARRGARVTAVDIAPAQVAAARELAVREGLEITFQVAAAEAIDFPGGAFDVVAAGQSWLYFDAAVMVPKVLALLASDGALVLTHLMWLPRKDPIARATEALVLRYNPDWQGADYAGVMPPIAPWARGAFDLRTFTRWRRRSSSHARRGAAASGPVGAWAPACHPRRSRGSMETTRACWKPSPHRRSRSFIR
jgi:SAM-dependent methyltransferase